MRRIAQKKSIQSVFSKLIFRNISLLLAVSMNEREREKIKSCKISFFTCFFLPLSFAAAKTLYAHCTATRLEQREFAES
jgi:hypothetical protein